MRQVGPDLPLVLRIEDQVILLQKAVAGRAVVPRIGRAGVAQHLDVGRLIRQQRVDIREGVGGSALPVGVQADRTELAAELQRVVFLDHAEIVDEGHRVVGVRLPAAVLRAVAADQIAERRGARRSALAADARNRDRAREAHGERAGVHAGNERRDAVDAGLVAVEAQLGFIDDRGLADLLQRVYDVLRNAGDDLAAIP